MKPPNKPSPLAIHSLSVAISLRIAHCPGTRTAAKCNRSDNDADHFLGSCCQYSFPGELLGERKAREESLQTRGAAPPRMTAGGSSRRPKHMGRSKSVP